MPKTVVPVAGNVPIPHAPARQEKLTTVPSGTGWLSEFNTLATMLEVPDVLIVAGVIDTLTELGTLVTVIDAVFTIVGTGAVAVALKVAVPDVPPA